MSIVLALVGGSGLGGCTTVSGTGRTQFNFMSNDQEIALGAEAYQSELAGAPLITSGSQWDMVKRVVDKVSASAARLHPEATEGFAWEVKLIDDPKTVNAWALPGGKMAVYTGLLGVTANEAQLAAVVGHECSHAIARHGGERMSQQSAAQILAQGLGAGLSFSSMSPGVQQATMAAFGAGAQYGVLLPFSRNQESEADEIGLFIAADAGYDPREAVELWKRMGAAGGDKPPEWLSTHPSDDTRIARLNALMPKAMEIWILRGGQP
ncbi:MAG: M48 family metallopeptidase [Phycisphaerae bacterium]|nr:M48 family metallopeptidase [Phycisphaerae bacterium]